jgi:hypothetical protein
MEKVSEKIISKEKNGNLEKVKEFAKKVDKNKNVNRIYYFCNLILGIIIGLGFSVIAYSYWG